MGRVSHRWRRRLADSAWPRPGYVADGGRLGEFDVMAASVVGQGHLHDGTPRQDSYHFLALGDGAALAIADGVSARPMAGIGAELAAYVAVRNYAAELGRGAARDGWEGLTRALLSAIGSADDALRCLATDMELQPQELSTTLLIADLRRDSAGELVATTASVGNSSALSIAPDGSLAVIGGPAEGGSPAPYNHFLPGSPEHVVIARAILPAEATFLLVTDGLADDLHSSPMLRSWVRSRLSGSLTPIEFAHVFSYRRQGSSDDLTAVVAIPPAEK